MLNNIPAMVAVTESVIKSTQLPVTVKTRLGWDETKKNILEIALILQDLGIKAITIHGRTRSQMYKGKADWTLIGEVKHHPLIHIPVIGNGDIDSPEKAKEMFDQYGVDGIMIGRAAIGRPWIFREIKHFLLTGEKLPEPSVREKVEWARRHFLRSVEYKGIPRGIFEMRRHFSNYFKGLPGFKEIRLKLVTSVQVDEILGLLDLIARKYEGYDYSSVESV
jgi:nifR3 family TIM-barrel protein